MKKQLGGGVYYRGDNFDLNIIKTLLSKGEFIEAAGSFSFILKCDVSEMQFITTDLKNFGQNPKKLLIKLGIVYEGVKPEYFKITKLVQRQKVYEQTKSVISQTKSDFNKEVLKQIECYEMTSKSLQALCPNIIYSNSHDLDFFRDLNFKVDKISKNKVAMDKVMVSVIIMEILDNFESMSDYKLDNYDDTKENIETKVRFHNMARYAVIEYALMTGCVHGDLGLPNILISPEYTGYYLGDSKPSLVGRPAIIDFGNAQFIPNLKEEIFSILESKSPTKFTDALSMIRDAELSFNPDNEIRYDWNYSNTKIGLTGYGWIYNPEFFKTGDKSDNLETKIRNTNKMLSIIHGQREIAKRNPIAIGRTTYNIPIDNEEQFVNNLFPVQEEKSTYVPMQRLDLPTEIESDDDDEDIGDWFEEDFNSEMSGSSSSGLKDSRPPSSLSSSSRYSPISFSSNSELKDSDSKSSISQNSGSPGLTDSDSKISWSSNYGSTDSDSKSHELKDPGNQGLYKNNAFSDYYNVPLSTKRGGTIKKYRKYRQKKRSLKKKNFMTIKKQRKRKTHRRK